MSKYTTGELAKLCDISVRTVQYYDKRSILEPSEISEGGRRLYSEEDLIKMKIICYLRSLNISIESIKELLDSKSSNKVLLTLLEEQELILKKEIEEKQEQLSSVIKTERILKILKSTKIESLKDVEYIRKNTEKLNKLNFVLIVSLLLLEIMENVTLWIWIKAGVWYPFVITLTLITIILLILIFYYYKKISYICPECHSIFDANLKEIFFSIHTLRTRKLKCKNCGYHGFCVATYRKEEKDVTNN